MTGLTKEPIARQLELETQEALKRVAPEATDFVPVAAGKSWDALQSGTRVGTVLAVKAKGYGGPISIILGLDGDEKITGVRVVSQTETPGLGNKVASEGFLRQFVGLKAEELWLKKDKPSQGGVDAIASATISSRAVTGALREAAGRQ